MKNYIILGLISIIFVLGSLLIIKNYSQSEKMPLEKSLIKENILEIKTSGLKDFFLETPDVIIWLTKNDYSLEFAENLIAVFAKYNLLSEMVYLNTTNLTKEEIVIINQVIGLDYENYDQLDVILVMKDFELVGEYAIDEEQMTILNLEVFLNRQGFESD